MRIRTALIVLLSGVLAHSAVAASTWPGTRKVRLPGENGKVYEIEVQGAKVRDPAGFTTLRTVARVQSIDTNQVSLELSDSPLRFGPDGKFVGLVPSDGRFKGAANVSAFALENEEKFGCFLLVGPKFDVRKACAGISAKVKPANGVEFIAPNARVFFREDGSLERIDYVVENPLLRDAKFFPTVQDESLAPGNGSSESDSIRTHALLRLMFDAEARLRSVSGTSWGSVWAESLISRNAVRLATAKLEPQRVYFWDRNTISLEIAPDGTLSGAKLLNPVSRTVQGEAVSLDLYHDDSLGHVETRVYRGGENSDDLLKVGGRAVLDRGDMDIDDWTVGGERLCTKLGTPTRRGPANPIAESVFYRVLRETGAYRVTGTESLYDPYLGKNLRYGKDSRVSLVRDVTCPIATSAPL